MSDIFSIARFVVGMAILGLASMSDIRTRTVANKYWIIMGSLGILILLTQILMSVYDIGDVDDGYESIHILALVPTIIMFFDVFWDREPLWGDSINFTALIVFIIGGLTALIVIYENGLDTQTIQLLTIPIMIIIGYIFFFTGVIHGGADAKAFMAIAVLMPFMPAIGDLTPLIPYPEHMAEAMSILFPFAFLTLMNSAIISVFGVIIIMTVINVSRKDMLFPALLFGYRMDLDEVPKKFVWLMEVEQDGEIVMYLFGKRKANTDEEIIKLKEYGIDRVWVTPKQPFIVAMFLGFAFSFIVGNVMVPIFNQFIV